MVPRYKDQSWRVLVLLSDWVIRSKEGLDAIDLETDGSVTEPERAELFSDLFASLRQAEVLPAAILSLQRADLASGLLQEWRFNEVRIELSLLGEVIDAIAEFCEPLSVKHILVTTE
jgi:hypothetical protein